MAAKASFRHCDRVRAPHLPAFALVAKTKTAETVPKGIGSTRHSLDFLQKLALAAIFGRFFRRRLSRTHAPAMYAQPTTPQNGYNRMVAFESARQRRNSFAMSRQRISACEKEDVMGFISSFKRGLSGDYSYEIAGEPVVCPHCGSRDFEKSDAQLNTVGLTFLGLDWANRSATILICKNCGRIEWFLEG